MERHIQRKKIFDQSVLIDELIHVYNRRFFGDTLPLYFNDYKRSGRHFSISIIDLVHFKRVNDQYVPRVTLKEVGLNNEGQYLNEIPVFVSTA